jgi:hypothetical protein
MNKAQRLQKGLTVALITVLSLGIVSTVGKMLNDKYDWIEKAKDLFVKPGETSEEVPVLIEQFHITFDHIEQIKNNYVTIESAQGTVHYFFDQGHLSTNTLLDHNIFVYEDKLTHIPEKNNIEVSEYPIDIIYENQEFRSAPYELHYDSAFGIYDFSENVITEEGQELEPIFTPFNI